MTVNSLVAESLPFGQRLQISTPESLHLQDWQSSDRSDSFQRFTAQPPRVYKEDEVLRHPQLYELAFNSHPFLALIVCRTIFLGDVDERAHDKALYDAILLAGLGVKKALSQNGPSKHAKPHGFPNMDELVRRTTSALCSTKLGSLKAAGLHTSAQCMMLLAWHELTHGLIKRAATWWTMICGMIHQVHAAREREETRPDCHVNGVDLSLVVAEELDNMHTIAHLMLLWLELHLGPIQAHTSMKSCVASEQAHDPSSSSSSSTSKILELDSTSGKISAMEAYQRSWTLLRSIDRVLGSLADTFHEWKVANGVFDTGTLPDTALYDEATVKVNAILTQARLLQSGSSVEPSAAALISLTALFACFQFKHPPISISEQSVINIVKVCSAITLQLRDTFSDSKDNVDPTTITRTAGTAKCSHFGVAYFADTMDGHRIVLTMIETIALTFELLLAHIDSDGVPDSFDTSEVVIWSPEAQQMVAEKLGNVLGILSAIQECFDNIPKQGRRPGHVLGMVERIKGRIEKLGIQPDVSFALEVFAQCAREEAGEPQREGHGTTEEALPEVLPYEPVRLHCSPTNESIFSMLGNSAQWQTSPYPTISSEAYHSGLMAAYPTPPYIHTNLAPPSSKGPLRFGPGPLPMSRYDRPEAAISSQANWHGGNLNLRLAYQEQAPAWRGANHVDFSVLASATPERLEGLRMAADGGGGVSKAGPSMVYGESVLDRAQQGAHVVDSLGSTQNRGQERASAHYANDPRTTLGLSAMQANQMWARHEPVYLQASAVRSDTDCPGEARDSKRARIEMQTRQLQWDARGDTRNRGVGEGSSFQTGLAFGQDLAASVRAEDSRQLSGSHLPAAEALASIKGIEPLEDDTPTGDSHWRSRERETGEGKSRRSRFSISSAIMSTSLNSLTDEEHEEDDDDDDNDEDEDNDEEYVDD
ncbi:hypothetical protein EX895_000370 [Sporisorium graminicola]|uniref:Transcription factor domain-containing protein n=1 Tax=Sporisorium graminicola TaxID=280036 RepID=A0A4U7L4K2_9BASI|nr:hypothetical protein EX895_000370 [Sporisorium graminicola]TKY90372.1 hypothetical protein EX895_000370 [Sporisorium graminicola]